MQIFTDPGDVVIDPCFGSGTTARACQELGRNFYGFEISKTFYRRAVDEMLLKDKGGTQDGHADRAGKDVCGRAEAK